MLRRCVGMSGAINQCDCGRMESSPGVEKEQSVFRRHGLGLDALFTRGQVSDCNYL